MRKIGLNKIKTFFEIKDYEVPIFRLWAVIVAFVCPFYGWVLEIIIPTAIEKLDARLFISALYGIIVLISFKNEKVRQYLPFYILILDLITICFITWLVAINSFSSEYSFGLFFAFCSISAIRRNIIEMGIYSTIFLIILTFVVYNTPHIIFSMSLYFVSVITIIIVNLLVFIRKTYENNQLKILNSKLEQANQELRTFSYIASHDIKEPIRVIGGYAGLIFKQLPNDLKEKLGSYFDTIKRSTIQLYTLIEDFAYYSTLSKNETIKTESVDLNMLIYNVIDSLQESIIKYNGEVFVNHLPTIYSNNTFLFTAFKNLIENGLKYNKSEKPAVEVSYQETKNTEGSGQAHHKIIISDNGIGIDKKYHEQIFEMFKRLHNRGAYEGSGIGLAIVKLVTEKLGGTVEVESEIGKKTKFIIILPK